MSNGESGQSGPTLFKSDGPALMKRVKGNFYETIAVCEDAIIAAALASDMNRLAILENVAADYMDTLAEGKDDCACHIDDDEDDHVQCADCDALDEMLVKFGSGMPVGKELMPRD